MVLGGYRIFIGGVLIVAFLQAVKIMIEHFVLFCAASLALGIAYGYAYFYRRAAIDCATEQARRKAIYYVLAGAADGDVFWRRSRSQYGSAGA